MSSFIKFFSTHYKGQVSDRTRLELIQGELEAIRRRQSQLNQMDEDIELSGLIDEVLPLLDAFTNYDPTPQYLYDNSGGEPQVSSRELWHAGLAEHQRLHS